MPFGKMKKSTILGLLRSKKTPAGLKAYWRKRLRAKKGTRGY
jgi:hypothetical protein